MGLLLIFLQLVTAQADTHPDHIVFIADSHGLGAFGETIREWLRTRAHTQFSFVASGGSAPLQWTNDAYDTECGLTETSLIRPGPWKGCQRMHTPTLVSLWLASYKQLTRTTRTISIIALGTNFSIKESRAKEHEDETKELAGDAVRESEICIWVGPPNMRRAPGFDAEGVAKKYRILEKSTEGCVLIDSRKLSTYPKNTGDGIHYQWPGSNNKTQIEASQVWAKNVIQKIEEVLKNE